MRWAHRAEQLFRNTPDAGRWAIKPLCIGLGGAFSYDLFLYSDGLLFRHLDSGLWSARGLAHALTIPLILVSAARNKQWTIDIAVSRRLVFSSTSILLSGAYLLAIAGAGYYVRYFGSQWGSTVQGAFFFAALLLLAAVFSSGTMRAKLRVLVNKHFFSYRYDYREEWLRVTHLLSNPDPELGLNERCIKGLADLVESPAGVADAVALGRAAPAVATLCFGSADFDLAISTSIAEGSTSLALFGSSAAD